MKRKIILFSGPIRSGKTSRLRNWLIHQEKVVGLISPDKEDYRIFIDLRTGHEKKMQAEANESFFEIGRFRFSTACFIWANRVLIDAVKDDEAKVLVIDEIGPLELQQSGLYEGLRTALKSLRPEVILVLVIREHLVDKYIGKFGLSDFEIEYL
jgi:nucleoside-triphosphatase THEP1